MKITVFNGSPRAEHGNTHVMVSAFLEGARAAGAETENIFLAKKKIHHCMGCFSCWIKTPGRCAIQDDMAELLPKLAESDIVVFATPLYVDNVSGLMKNFMDRMIPNADPHFSKDQNGECRHPSRFPKAPKIVVISNCGFPERSHFQVLQLLFRRVALNMRSEVIGEIYCAGGAILSEKSFWLGLRVNPYKQLIRKAGEEMIRHGKIPEELAARLEEKIISDEQYIKGADDYWKKVLAETRENPA